jgi:hypothetical protein
MLKVNKNHPIPLVVEVSVCGALGLLNLTQKICRQYFSAILRNAEKIIYWSMILFKGDSVKCVLTLPGKDNSIENIRLIVHESIINLDLNGST